MLESGLERLSSSAGCPKRHPGHSRCRIVQVLQPACYGGYEADLSTYFDVVMTLSGADGSVGWVYSVLLVRAGRYR